MIPSILAGQLRQGVEDFLETTFPISTPFFHGMLNRFLEKEGNLFKGPYLSVLFPFKDEKGENNFFKSVPMPYSPWKHQLKAFQRLSGENPQSTLIATGTGSGKTECFMYPILDYCFRHRGEPGIKAILIYPMNALASDQAERLAQLIYKNPKLRGYVTAGLYVGQSESQPQAVMSENKIITEKSILRKHPPDILLTNYKMLDYLLIRPWDRELWRENHGKTLKYLVVDELHTFNGAQGTDLACLLRRLKSRLDTPEAHLCCIGTSATFGTKEELTGLITYAEAVFNEPFANDSIITEVRFSSNEFFADSPILFSHIIDREHHEALKASTYNDMQSYTRAQYRLWFEAEAPADITGPGWKSQLGLQIKSHELFQQFLKILRGRILGIPDLIEELKRISRLPGNASNRFYLDVVNSMCALISTARDKDGSRPFLEVRVQFWMRELRRMVAEIKPQPELCYSDDLKDPHPYKHLPVIHCRDCGSTGWGGVFNSNDSTIRTDLKEIYYHFFKQGQHFRFLFPIEKDPGSFGLKEKSQYLCSHCLTLSNNPTGCPACRGNDLIRVFVPDMVIKGKNRNTLKTDCPFCNSPRGLSILGSQAASLTSVLIGQIAASTYNRDKKMIAFSDSVQDAAHRAGFFNGRTYSTNFRSALAQLVEHKGEGVSLQQLPGLFTTHWLELLGEPTYITTFIGPNMEWLSDFDFLKAYGKLPEDSDLLNLVNQRIHWNIYSEYGYRARIGRTLERSSVSLISPNAQFLQKAIEDIITRLRNEVGGLRKLQQKHLKQFLLGMLMHLKLMGGIFHPALNSYIEGFGQSTYILNKIPYLPSFAPYMRGPTFISNRSRGDFEPPVSSGTGLKTWYETWLYKNFFQEETLIMSMAESIYKILLEGLTGAGILEKLQVKQYTVWGLRADALQVTNQVEQFNCKKCRHNVSAAGHEREYWEGMPCQRLSCDGEYTRAENTLDYYGKLYRTAHIHRIVAREHTGLLGRDERNQLERGFKDNKNPWDPNLLSATPTIEMGIDIGDLSSVLLCSVPPTTANYLQRIGRAGRTDGNALNVTLANGKPHDLYFFAEPGEMIAGKILPPGVYLEASAILERQFTAFCFDHWVRSGIEDHEFPKIVRTILNHVDAKKQNAFPYTFLGFIENRQNQLFDDFIELFKKYLSGESILQLRRFVEGDKAKDGSLGYRILNNLQLLSKERKSYKSQLDNLRRQIKRKEKDPVRDKNYEQQLEQLKTEKNAMQELIKGIENKDALNFFTDEGLIPNYTFPEAGVILKSIVYRKRKEKEVLEEGEESGSKYRYWVYEYERPARSAISELAPANRFYAGGRKVSIDRVDLNLSGVEHWRFCPDCSYSECLDISGDNKKYCPRCGGIMWSDSGQKHIMLRMRQVFASTHDKESRISDDKDEREPVFYNKQMLVDFAAGDISDAYKISGEEIPFGFEFLKKAVFREVNFGERSEEGEITSIAGIEMQRQGFIICRYCGKIQRINRGSDPAGTGKHEHALGCTAPDKDNGASYTQYLYLYREFTSEAIRILMPVTNVFGYEKKLRSFIAALHLGLKKKFAGEVDHLQTTLHEEPIMDSPLRKKYLVLYDQVPGGTGYLKQLMRSQYPLLEVLEQALETLKTCQCASDPDKDGCYRCLLAFRTSYDMRLTSRSTAMEMLSKILQYKDALTSTDHLRQIDINRLFDSDLEARFIEALKHFQKQGRDVSITEEIMNRKTCYYLKVNKKRYRIEPQVSLDQSRGISLASRADFVIWPLHGTGSHKQKPIAVFADGFAYHKNRIGSDTAQRMAVVQSNRFLTWSITWKDVENPFNSQGNYYSNFLDLGQERQPHDTYYKILQSLKVDKLRQVHQQNSFELLMSFLAEPDAVQWSHLAFAHVLYWLSINAGNRYEDSFSKEKSIVENKPGEILTPEMMNFFQQLPDPQRGWLQESNNVICLVSAAKQGINARDINQCFFAAHLDDTIEPSNTGDFEKEWISFLRLYNLLQFLPLSFMTSQQGIKESLYEKLSFDRAHEALEVSPAGELDPEWETIKMFTDMSVHPIIEKLISANAPLPEIGYELQKDNGEITAEGELAWPDKQLVLLTTAQEIYHGAFTSAGWHVVLEKTIRENMGPLLKNLQKDNQ